MTTHRYEIEQPYAQGDPLEFDDGRQAAQRASRMRRDAEADLRQAIHTKGNAEGNYRKLLAQAIVRMRQDHPATVAVDMAKGETEVNKALIDFRVAEGMIDAHRERLKTIEGDRSMIRGLIDFSAGVTAVLRDHDEAVAA